LAHAFTAHVADYWYTLVCTMYTGTRASVLLQVKRGLELGLAPVLSLEGTGGTYFMTDTRKRKLAAFKPQDEEPFAPNNPRGFIGMGVSALT
jgi:hypothetical protein